MSALTALLRTAPIPAHCQSALIDRPDLLSANPYLCAEVWFQLYPTRPLPAVDRAVELAARPLTDEQMLHLARHETRRQVIAAALEYNTTAALGFVDAIVARDPKRTAAVANAVSFGARDDRDTARLMGHRAGGEAQLWAIVTDDTLSDAELVAAADAVAPVGAEKVWNKQRNAAWTAAMALRPTLCGFRDLPDAAVTAAAGCVHLWRETDQLELLAGRTWREYRFMHMALAANPACTRTVHAALEEIAETNHDWELTAQLNMAALRATQTAPVAEESNKLVLQRLMLRTLPSEHRLGGRPWTAYALAANIWLTTDQRYVLANMLSQLLHPTAKLHPLARRLLVDATERLGHGDLVPSNAPTVWHWPPVTAGGTLDQVTAHTFVSEAHTRTLAQQLADRIGDSPSSWRVAADIADDFRGSAEELASVAAALG